MSANGQLNDAFPHGSVEGYRSGCHGSFCLAAISCRDFYRRYSGDAAFRKAVHAGITLEEIARSDREQHAGAVQRDREAERQSHVRKQSPPRFTDAEPVRAHVRTLMAAGLSLQRIADRAGVSASGLSTLIYGRSGPRKGQLPARIDIEKAARLTALTMAQNG